MTNRALEDAAFAQDGQRQQVYLAIHNRPGREPRLPRRPLIALRRRMKAHGDARWRCHAKIFRDVVARAKCEGLNGRPLAFVIVWQRKRDRRWRRDSQRRDGQRHRVLWWRDGRWTRQCWRRNVRGHDGRRPERNRRSQRRRSRSRAAERDDVEARIVAVQNLRGRLSAGGEIHRADDAHADAVSVAMAFEVIDVAAALHLERRALHEQPAHRASDDRAQVLP